MELVSLISDIFTIVASGMAIYLFVAKRKSISSIFKLLLNYSYQLTLSELKEKLERLNDYNANDPDQIDQIKNIMNEIIGQVRGNERLKKIFSELLGTMEDLVLDRNRRKLTEPRKRSLISELRERIRHLNVKSIDDFLEKDHE